MEEQHSRVKVGDGCLQCGADIFECRVTDGDVMDHWHECKCGCACVDCRMPMTYQERDTSSGIEYRSYRCPRCGREGCVRAGVALWKAFSQADEPERKPLLSDATPRWFTYEDVDGPKVVRLTPGEWVVGRDPDCAIVVRDFGCSRRHAKLVVEAEGVRIVDLKSKGGTQVSNRPVIEARLKSGDEVRLGTVLFRFVEGPAPPIPITRGADDPGPKPRPGLAKLTAALERPPGSLREQTRLGELAGNLGALYAVHRVSAAFKVELPWERLILINTVGELLDLIEQAAGTLSERDGS